MIKEPNTDILCRPMSGTGTLMPPTDFSGRLGLLRVTEGSAELFVGSQKAVVKSGSIAVMAEGSVSCIFAREHCTAEVLVYPVYILHENMERVDRELCDMFMLQAGLRPYLLDSEDSVYPELNGIFEQTVTEYLSKQTCYRLTLRANICCFAASLLRFYSEAKRSKDKLLYHNVARLISVAEYAQSHLGKKLTVPELSEQMNLSPAYFSHLMQEATGRTAMEYLHSLRLNAAMRQLISTKHTVSEIAKALGYSGGAYFSRLFASQMNMSPVEYRRLCSESRT